MAVDGASPQIIERTDEQWKSFVRFYFRPRTPTQFHNEGIRPQNQPGPLKAHCPMPVFLLFDANDLLTREETQFSRGSLAADSDVGSTAEFFASIPFEKVYHDLWLPEEEKRTTVFHRQAEVIIPKEVDLSALKWIVCRSPAEHETLRWSVSERCWNTWSQRTTFGSRGNLFFRRCTFVDSADIEQNRILLRFNESSSCPGPFAARLTVVNPAANVTYVWQSLEFYAKDSIAVRIPQIVGPIPFEVSFWMDEYLAYRGKYSPLESVW